ncbi:RING finger and transmembrane domain-containing protein 2 isoform X3 [Antechinus flavipes]|uniref:RING finger and transmembrane domain-containing protein 2 isoform X3 n=1 Tax=Antechinus flavipes TaxID=38775 RepID=UPI002235CC13|nr:RING finger and transmembrane domain-containing protein 2 isoform X3 [Antechinus flavipes]
MWLTTLNQVLRKMQRRHSSNTESAPPERLVKNRCGAQTVLCQPELHLLASKNRSQTLSSETSVDEGGVFEGLKLEDSSPPPIFSGLAGLQSGTLSATPFQSGLVLGSSPGGGEVFIQMPASREEGTSRGESGTFHHRPASHHFHHGHHRGSSLLHVGGDRHGHGEEGGEDQPGTPAPALSELKAVICWLQKGLPFILILLAKLCFQHKLGIAVCIGMASTFAYANSTLREQVSLKEKRSVLVIFWILAFLVGNTLYVLYTFSSQQLYNSLIFLKPNLDSLDFFDLLWIVGIADFMLKYITIALKCLIVALPKIILAVKSKSVPQEPIGAHKMRPRGTQEAGATGTPTGTGKAPGTFRIPASPPSALSLFIFPGLHTPQAVVPPPVKMKNCLRYTADNGGLSPPHGSHGLIYRNSFYIELNDIVCF